jgi:hypothetical protein
VFEAVVRDMRDGVLVLHTPAQVAPGTAVIMELNPGKPDRHVLQGVVQDVLTISGDQIRLQVRCEALPPAQKKPSGLFGWLRWR